MTPLRTIHIDSLDGLRASAEAWDDIWRRSDATLPSLRAELLAQWVQHFARPGDFHAVAIESAGQWVAAMPLVRRRVAVLFQAGAMPSNEWSASGDVLLDCSVGKMGTGTLCAKHPPGRSGKRRLSPFFPPLLDALAAAIGEMPWPLLWLDEAVLDAPRWRALAEAFVRAGMTVAEHPRWQVGRVEIDHDWDAYRARWSRKHRQQMAWSMRRMSALGEVRLALRSQWAPGDAAAALRRCFEIEDRGWKGAAGTSILRTPGMTEFFAGQAELAAGLGHLEVATLYCGDRAVAFCYGLSAKGVFHSLKTSYDPAFAQQRPGQLLRYCLLERFFADAERKALDFQGIICEAHAAWLPQLYTVGRLAVAPRSPWGRLAVRAYRDLWLAAT